MKAHAYANLFPLMTDEELETLAADIAENGLRHPIVTYGGGILDGRNRHAACLKAGVEPRFEEFDGDDEAALRLVISLNVQRRDMTPSQRAIVAAKAMRAMPERRGRPGKGGKSSHVFGETRGVVAKTFKVSDKYVQYARAVLDEASDLAERVEVATLPLAAAYEEFQERQKRVRQEKKDRERVSEFAEAISNGDMMVEEALQMAMEREREEKQKAAAEADARSHWLKELAGLVEWVERYVADRTDEDLPWYTLPGSPGMYDHGITAKRLAIAIEHLGRCKSITFGG